MKIMTVHAVVDGRTGDVKSLHAREHDAEVEVNGWACGGVFARREAREAVIMADGRIFTLAADNGAPLTLRR